jgi:hypothetical protein
VFGEFQGQNKGFEKVELVISPPVGEMAGRAEGWPWHTLSLLPASPE